MTAQLVELVCKAFEKTLYLSTGNALGLIFAR